MLYYDITYTYMSRRVASRRVASHRVSVPWVAFLVFRIVLRVVLCARGPHVLSQKSKCSQGISCPLPSQFPFLRCLSIYLSIYLSLSLSIYIYVSIYLSTYVYFHVYIYIYLSLSLSIYIYIYKTQVIYTLTLLPSFSPPHQVAG